MEFTEGMKVCAVKKSIDLPEYVQNDIVMWDLAVIKEVDNFMVKISFVDDH